jgi:CubicO group peptidase (beta-lactamase class C family)
MGLTTGSTFLYSDLNFMNLGFVLETTSGKTLDQLVSERLTKPLGMTDTFYNVGNLPAHQGEHSLMRLS